LPNISDPERESRLFVVRGAVQGVGFRPFVYRLCRTFNLAGWVRNDGFGVTIQVSGSARTIAAFRRALLGTHPPAARIDQIEEQPGNEDRSDQFQILPSLREGSTRLSIGPDLATCADCLREILNPDDRRYLYPFTNCTQCGPRFSIVLRVPYDREQTTMAGFTMCAACSAEYNNPDDRRHHAQPNACPDCGPRVTLVDRSGKEINEDQAAIRVAARRLCSGEIVAVKGIGGFHLLCDAQNERIVRELRQRKHRESKPLAVLFPDEASIHDACEVTPDELFLMRSSAAPIVLINKRDQSSVAAAVALRLPVLGCFLPYSPVHHLLTKECAIPLVATSGNLSDEPICITNEEALVRLSVIADSFLFHNRPIARPIDDSVVRMAAGRPMLLRRARGYAPLPIRIPGLEEDPTLLATGAHLKNTIAIKSGADVFLSQHIGDLETAGAREAQRETVITLSGLLRAPVQRVACDLHPDYGSTRLAEEVARGLVASGEPIRVQHHHAHLAACMADNGLDFARPVLGATWDGTGFGMDRTIWGGEFLLGRPADFTRIASIRPFRLLTGGKAIREPRLTALGMLNDWIGPETWEWPGISPLKRSEEETRVLRSMLLRDLNCPVTTSVGRLFDAVAALLGLQGKGRLGYEGEAALALEARASLAVGHDASRLLDLGPLPWTWRESATYPFQIDLAPAIRELVGQLDRGDPMVGVLAARFHRTLVDILVSCATRFNRQQLLLTGGCFQNRLLLEGSIRALQKAGIEPVWHRDLPPNDGSISLGQIVVASMHGSSEAAENAR
jgi:hydrogenase maturation protein HypF